ncbi:hypothetical protein [Metabacillus bambusae]|uniref:Uncharacterized protein n=1 Tax=Metabacillus bambusae TaxID=2795218 RepID=A0ABS3N6A8_9BACI|nr:hypothetical protein [Metabacillus bambusae]MBO1513703.1 hypothetical protein [Metabacillus bambusae]
MTVDKQLKKMSENYISAYEIRSSMAGYFNTFKDFYLEDRNKVMNNRELTHAGKEKRLERVKQRHEIDFMKMFREQEAKRNELLNENIKIAKSIILAELPPVDAETEKLFTKRVEELEGKIIFATNLDAAKKALEEIAAIATEPALAATTKEKIKQLSQQVLALAPSDKVITVKYELGKLFEDVSSRALPQGAIQATEALESAQEFLGMDLVQPFILDNLGQISNDLVRYANNTESYFIDKADVIKDIEMNGKGY